MGIFFLGRLLERQVDGGGEIGAGGAGKMGKLEDMEMPRNAKLESTHPAISTYNNFCCRCFDC